MGSRNERALNSAVWGHVRVGFSLAVLFELGFEVNGNSWNGEDGKNEYFRHKQRC